MHDVLKESGRSSVGGKRVRWFSGAMVVVELALTLVLLAGAGLMIRSFAKLYAQDLGFSTSGLMALRVILPPPKYETPDARRAVLRTARAAAPDDSWRRCGGGDDERAAVRIGGSADRD